MRLQTTVLNLYCLFPYIHILCSGNCYFPGFKALIKAEDLILPRDRHVLCLCAVSCYVGTFMITQFTSLLIFRTDENVKKTTSYVEVVHSTNLEHFKPIRIFTAV